MKTIGIIGFGPFGQFIVPYLSPYFDIKVTSRTKREALAKKLGAEFLPLDKLLDVSDIVIISLAIPVIPDIVKKIKDKLRPGMLIIDVASVKEYTTEIMRKELPDYVDILGTHPLFGPQSGKNGIEGLKIVLTPVHIKQERLKKIEEFLKDSLKLRVFVMSPEEHDRAMSRTQVITQFIGRILKRLNIKEEELSLPSYELLLKLYNTVGEDSDTLFSSIQLYNRYGKEVREKIKETCEDLYEELEEKKKTLKIPL